jgi:hypothetical protein
VSGGRDGVVKAWDARRSWSLPVLLYDLKNDCVSVVEGVGFRVWGWIYLLRV